MTVRQVQAILDEDEEFLTDLHKAARKTSLKEEIADIYASGQESNLRDGLHLSDVIGRKVCYRKCVLAYCYHQNQTFLKYWRAAIYDNGKYIHRRWQAVILRSGKAIGIEMEHIEMFWRILFTPDIILNFRGKPTVMEIKGYNAEEFERLTKPRRDGTEAKLPWEAIVQCQLYMWFTGITQGLIIVENKNTQDFAPWFLQFDYDIVKPWIKKFDLIKRLIENHMKDLILPVRWAACPDEDSDVAQACGCREVCFGTKEFRETKRREIWLAQVG